MSTPHAPMRGSDVEAWLKRRRDEHRQGAGSGWTALDHVLDAYRDHADTGTPLDRNVQGPHFEQTGELLVENEPETDRHEFVHVTYKGRFMIECGHVTMVSMHEGRMCNLPATDPIHL